MPVKIVTDSTCDLPQNVIDELGITVLPCFINFDTRSFLDGIDLSPEDFYRKLENTKVKPTSAAPSLGSFVKVYQKLLREGASSILSIHLSTRLASTYNISLVAARSVAADLIHPFDGGQLSLGTGLLVEAAAKLALLGASLGDILERVSALKEKTYAYATAGSLEYLRKSGRIAQIIAGVGSILQIKPVLHIHAGKVGLDLVRTSHQGIEKLVRSLQSLSPLEQISIVHTNAPEKANQLLAAISEVSQIPASRFTVNVSPAIGVHFGPGAVGFVGITAKP